MLTSKKALALLLALALAAPATAFGQSAGDEQYSDPFQETEEPAGGGQQGDSGQGGGGQEQGEALGGGDGSAESTAPGGEVVEPDTGQPAVAQELPAASGAPTLPVTGLPAALLAIMGGGLLLGGIALRRTT